jgi:glutamyl-tRNA reductase
VIHVAGISHRRTPVQRREKAAVSAAALPEMLQRARERLGAAECVILSTCNRTEVYYVTPDADGQALGELLMPHEASRGAIPESEVYRLSGADAATHLCEVAAGLDSLILGEHEILAQVKAALEAARAAGSAGPLLTRLLHHAVRAGKRARAETAIASGIFSIGHCAAQAASNALGSLPGKALLVIGAGRIAEATAKHLSHQGASPIVVANRTLNRAREVAQRLDARAESITDLPRLLPAADIIVTCTSAPHFILDAAQVLRAMEQRPGRPLVIIDVSVPRDVEPDVETVPGVRLFNLDGLEPIVASNAKARAGEVTAARAIIAQEVHAFDEWQARGEVAPLIDTLRRRGELVRQECLDEARRRLCHLPPEDIAAVERMTDLLVKRLLHAPTAALRAQPHGEPFTLAAAVKELFDLTESGDMQPRASSDARRSATSTYRQSLAGGRDHAHPES